MKSLGEVGEIKRGVAFTKKQAVFGKFPVVANAAEPITFHNEFNRNGEFIVVARSGANAGLISYWNEELFLTDAFSGKNGQIDHPIPVQIDHLFRLKLTTQFRSKLTT